jgi:hypothetical protein
MSVLETLLHLFRDLIQIPGVRFLGWKKPLFERKKPCTTEGS